MAGTMSHEETTRGPRVEEGEGWKQCGEEEAACPCSSNAKTTWQDPCHTPEATWEAAISVDQAQPPHPPDRIPHLGRRAPQTGSKVWIKRISEGSLVRDW